MSSYIHNEMFLFLQSVITGAVLLFCYDILRAVRKVIPHSTAAIAAEDLIYWTGCSMGVFACVYRSNQGILRFFSFRGGLGSLALFVDSERFFCKSLRPDAGNSCHIVKNFDKMVAISDETL